MPRRSSQATWGEGASGACFAVIRERWKQFLFGFYPAELYWRPTLAFILMFVGARADPVLRPAAQDAVVLGRSIPGVAYWLLWGGSIFVPIVVYAGFVVGVSRAWRPTARGALPRADRRARSPR